jgi:uncharacterized membrane protein
MTVTEQEITSYADAVRRALGDLPAEVRDELTEDLAEHLTEVAAEADGALAERLGPPEAYAAELRAAAGVRPALVAGRNLDDKVGDALRVARARLGTADVRLGPLLGYDRVSDFLTLLRPAWWILRAYLLAMLITVLTTTEFGLLPSLNDSVVAGVLLLLALLVGSVWLGRRERRFAMWPRIFVGAAGVTLVLFAVAAVLGGVRWSSVPEYYQSTQYEDPYVNVQDVYVYDAQGRLVEGARLFDQNGEPIRLGTPYCDPDAMVNEPVQYVYPFCPERAPFGLAPGVGPPAPEPSEAPSPEPTAPTAVPTPQPTAS